MYGENTYIQVKKTATADIGNTYFGIPKIIHLTITVRTQKLTHESSI